MSRFFVISGCSGGGKSTLLTALKNRGMTVVPEPGRRVIAAQRLIGGTALPWVDMIGFVDAVHSLARRDLRESADHVGPVFFDRGLVDAAAARAHYAGIPPRDSLPDPLPYARRVFLAPPWPEIFESDADRRHGFEDALAEYHRLQDLFAALGYSTVTLPKVSPEQRADFVLDRIDNPT